MKPLYPDTHPKIEEMLIEGYRKMSPEEKLRQTLGMMQFGLRLEFDSMKRKYPNETDEEIRHRILQRLKEEKDEYADFLPINYYEERG